jgi:hypothetical protein
MTVPELGAGKARIIAWVLGRLKFDEGAAPFRETLDLSPRASPRGHGSLHKPFDLSRHLRKFTQNLTAKA